MFSLFENSGIVPAGSFSPVEKCLHSQQAGTMCTITLIAFHFGVAQHFDVTLLAKSDFGVLASRFEYFLVLQVFDILTIAIY
jgi:hypothetical protein